MTIIPLEHGSVSQMERAHTLHKAVLIAIVALIIPVGAWQASSTGGGGDQAVTITVAAGGAVNVAGGDLLPHRSTRVTFHNQAGIVPYDFALEGTPWDAAFSHAEYAIRVRVRPGEQASFAVVFPEPGRYRFLAWPFGGDAVIGAVLVQDEPSRAVAGLRGGPQ